MNIDVARPDKYINLEIQVTGYLTNPERFRFYTKTGHITVAQAQHIVTTMMRQFPRIDFLIEVYEVETVMKHIDIGTFLKGERYEI